MNLPMQIAFLGGGQMARALIQGLLRQGVKSAQLRVGDPVEAQRASLTLEFGVSACADNHLAVADATVVVLAVKPQQLLPLLRELAPTLLRRRPLLVSIAAGLRIATLRACCPELPIVRAMPNRPALVGAGATALYAEADLMPVQRAETEALLGAVGRALWVPRESDLDIVTALSGSGPAYFFLLAEHLAAAAVAQGLDPTTAQILATQTLYGAGALAAETLSLAQQRAAVTSQGGTTAAALATLEQNGFDTLIRAAMAAATRRSVELATELGSIG